MKGLVRICMLMMICGYCSAQGYLEFIENKGQWDAAIRYKGDIGAGAFALHKDGYRIILYNQDDMEKFYEMAHPLHKTSATTNKKTNLADEEGRPLPETGGGSGGNGGTSQPADKVTLRGHVYQMRFLNANPAAQAVPDKALPAYNNYIIGNDPSKWGEGCKIFQAITYKNMYPGIDVRYYTANGTLKYDIIVNPGADVSQVAMYYEGLESLKQSEGGLVMKTTVDEVKELPPYTYQLVNGTRQEIPSRFEVKGNIVRFKIDGSYSKAATLVIDPSLVFSTFTGSAADNWGYTATYDGAGNFYAGGTVFSAGFPVSNGAFQSTFQGGSTSDGTGAYDIGIMKFDPTGVNRVYATYIGGSGNEQPHSMVVDASGNLVIAGRTNSPNYPLRGAVGEYRSAGSPGGGLDIIVTKLNATGTNLVGSVKVAGSGNDGVNIRNKYPNPGPESIDVNYGDDARSEVILDGAGNILVASCTQSDDFPTTPGAFQAAPMPGSTGRKQDAVLLKFTPNLSAVLLSTRMGGTDNDAAFVLAISPLTGNILVGGATASADMPGARSGVIGAAYNGGTSDGFIYEFTPAGTYVRSTYVGTSGTDLVYGLQFDKSGYPYIMGTTTGGWTIKQPAGAATFFQQAGGKQFISKLEQNLSDYVFSTTFGTAAATPNISPTAFLVDRCENLYVSGWGGELDIRNNYPNSGTRGLAITPDAYQNVTDGSDFYFIVLERDAKAQLYGSFFGEIGGADHVDGGTSRFDKNGVIYQSMCANCGRGGRFPTSAGVWAPNNGSPNCNLAALKIAFNLAGVGAGLRSSINGVIRDTTGCAPLTAVFSDTLAIAKTYIWDYNDGSRRDTTTIPSATHTFSNVGDYRVMLIAVDSSSCNITDTSYVTMRVRNDEAVLGFTATKQPPCTALNYLFTNTSTAPPGKPFNDTSFLWIFGDGTTMITDGRAVTHTYAAAGTYDVKLVLRDTGYCNYDDTISMQLRIATNVKAQFNTPALGCAPYTAVFDNTSLGGQSFEWDFGDGATSTATSPTHLYNNIGDYTIRLIAIDPNTCNIRDTAYFTISVKDKPQAGYSYTPKPTQPNTPVTFNNISAGADYYKWLFGDGDTLMTIRRDTIVQHLYNSSGNYNACLVAYNNAGCSDTVCQVIPITIIPLIDIPNAFSPNGDGRNDRIYVRGYGIAKMTWQIYNRWGVLVYTGVDKNEGWDGTYKGAIQPQDVYHYTLLLEFSDGKKITRKGDITLLR
ncbi:DUF7948 domain-containing protein [Sediminibacterium ginsengisoli]|uniref:DUF7948 domain-containing protein n=1 Tax=Sediminibacterium ginsengisoli TaxID=413434 RepID=UPI001FE7D7DB|nr:PKD domain-containing protein [Sediminibacterium ginsengisoli]